ncbi:hypothetical protein ACI68E_003864 [Malassezia pachydermatis]|uniref:PIN domain-like protein n=1 Tax=Malassezia pachydermatis TaxID=77020 RepID=A0A0M8MI15_9BASI|nr:hypothetical protein Malapachy_0500 [Malassezia pachydermatis]KOS12876.1 hypothetical protein Malapachy_0500 [Malassezia pachydermatis]
MGVLGLTRWANEMERLVSSEFTLPIPSSAGKAQENGEEIELNPEGDWLVIDAWAWIHHVWHSMNTNVYQGGSFLHFRVLMKRWIDLLRSANFKLVVVFDGPRLHQKIGTLLSRTQNYVRLNAKLMRAGPKLRTDHEFEHARMLPRGLTEYVYSILHACDVEVVMGASEVDAIVAKLADERAGYVLSRDSDFLILCGNAPRCKGYISLGSVEFIAQETAPAAPEAPPADDDGFMTVSTSKRNKKAAQQAKKAHLPQILSAPVLPSQSSMLVENALRFRCFSSYKCAELLKIPMTLLPVFAALVGTESRTSEQMELFNGVFHGVSNRMSVIASLLSEQYTAIQEGTALPPVASEEAPTDKEADDHDESATLDMSDPVTRLLAASFDSIVAYGRKRRGAPLPVSWAMRTSIVQAMHTAALSYIPEHGSEAMERFMAATDVAALKTYQDAYWAGHFDQALVSAMLERLYIARVYLEEPEEPPAQRVIVRPMRQVVWSLLFSVWLTAHPEEKVKVEEALDALEVAQDEAEAEVLDEVDVEEKVDDDAAEDDEEAEGEDEDEDEEPEPEPEPEETGPAPLTTVTEYTRTEYSLRKEEVPVPALPVLLETMSRTKALPSSLTSIVDAYGEAMLSDPEAEPKPVLAAELSESVRMDLWRYVHYSNIPSLEQLPADVQAFAAALRYTLTTNQQRLGHHRTRHNWSMVELQAAVYSACIARRVSKEATPTEMQAIVDAYPGGSPSNRSITLCTTLGFVLQMSALLTQTLALSDKLPHARPMWEPPLFHACLGATMDPHAKKMPPSEAWTRFEDQELFEKVMSVVLEGNESIVGRTRTAPPPSSQKSNAPRQRRHLGLLEETML